MNHSITILVISALVFIAMLWAFFTLDGIFQIILTKANYFITFLSLVTAAYSGYGLSRLTSFDKMDDLQERDAALIHKQVLIIRSCLESIIRFSLICSAILFFSGLLAAADVQSVYLFFGIFLSFTIAAIVFLILVMKGIFKRISDLRERLFVLSQTEKKRKALVEKMHEQAEKYPLSEMDFHFKRQRNTIN